MKTNFNTSFALVIGNEGGFQNDPKDRGNWSTGVIGKGINRGTKFGVTAMSYPTLDIRNITLDQARAIYKKDYWDQNSCDLLPIGVDYLVFDISVNHGVKDGATFLQRAVGVTADGSIGPATLRAVNGRKPQDVIEELCVVRTLDYADLGSFSRYGTGWLRRVMKTLAQADDMIDQPPLTFIPETTPSLYQNNTDIEPQSRWASLWKKVS